MTNPEANYNDPDTSLPHRQRMTIKTPTQGLYYFFTAAQAAYDKTT